MKRASWTDAAHSTGCAVVRGAVLAVAAAEASKGIVHVFLFIFRMAPRVVVSHHCDGRVSAAQIAPAGSRHGLMAGARPAALDTR
jgi:hypothetical protein